MSAVVLYLIVKILLLLLLLCRELLTLVKVLGVEGTLLGSGEVVGHLQVLRGGRVGKGGVHDNRAAGASAGPAADREVQIAGVVAVRRIAGLKREEKVDKLH